MGGLFDVSWWVWYCAFVILWFLRLSIGLFCDLSCLLFMFVGVIWLLLVAFGCGSCLLVILLFVCFVLIV